MTTTVTVAARCDAETTQVEVQVIDGDNDGQNIYLQDGESQDFHAFDNRSIVINEIPKR